MHEAALGAMRRGETAAVATVIETHGSTPRQVRAKMLITVDGQTVGTVGGETPREIAVSILAEIIAVQHGERGRM